MARYIDGDKLIECFENLCDDYLYRANEKAKIAVTRCIEILQGTPTADVVEVVRCKDCKYFNKDRNECFMHSEEDYIFSPETIDFCNYGERSDT